LFGTGPFKVAKFEPGKLVVLSANEQHWAGRPFLDGVEVRMGRAFRDQAEDAQVGQSDVTELPIGDVRRARQRGDVVTLSSPMETLALLFDRAQAPPAPVREAISLPVDRASIQSVLLQKMGEPSAALLPQWLSGHALAFPADRNIVKARQLSSAAQPLSFHYDRQDALLHAIAERIALNESECGITLRSDSAGPVVRLAWLRFTMPHPDLALDEIAATLGVAVERKADPFERESALLDGFYIVPIVQVNVAYTLNPRVQGWLSAPWIATDRWDLANIWLGEAAP
jgi:ABC-type transport system substrate-binding protein